MQDLVIENTTKRDVPNQLRHGPEPWQRKEEAGFNPSIFHKGMEDTRNVVVHAMTADRDELNQKH